MKTLQDVRKEITAIKSDMLSVRNSSILTKNEKKRKERNLSIKLSNMAQMEMFLGTSPSEEMLSRTLSQLKKQEESLSSSYDDWFINTPISDKGDNPKVTFNSVTGLNEIRKRIKTLKWILE